MKKRVTVILLCLLALALAACGAPAADEGQALDLSKYTVVDISHLQNDQMPADPALQLPKSEFFGNVGVNGGLHNLEVLSYCVHTGTHMDSPFHVIADGGSIETVDPAILIGPACVLKLDVPAGEYGITVADVQAWEADHGEIAKGDAVLFHTGHDALWGDSAAYLGGYPYLLPETAQYMVEKGVRYVAMESISVDTSTTESHIILLGAGVGVVENVCDLGSIDADRCYTIGTFPNSEGSTGVWVRILALY